MTYVEAGMTWLRQIEGYEPPRPGEVAVVMSYIDVTDYLSQEGFDDSKLTGERWGGEWHDPVVVWGAKR